MNVFEKSKLHADRRELGSKKDHNITLLCTKTVQCSKHFQSCNSNKDQNNFYKGIYGNSIRSLEHIIQPKSYRCIILYIRSPQAHGRTTRLKHPLSPQLFPRPV